MSRGLLLSTPRDIMCEKQIKNVNRSPIRRAVSYLSDQKERVAKVPEVSED